MTIIWLVKSVPKSLFSFLALPFSLLRSGGFWVFEDKGRFLSFMEHLGYATLFFISNLLYFKFMQMLLIWSLVILIEHFYSKLLNDKNLIQLGCLPFFIITVFPHLIFSRKVKFSNLTLLIFRPICKWMMIEFDR